MIATHETVTVVRPATRRDRYDNTVYDWDNATRAVYGNVAVLPTSQDESGVGEFRQAVTTGWRLYTRPGNDIDITPYDRVEWAGVELEVAGEVARWPHPLRRGGVHHVEVSLRRRTG